MTDDGDELLVQPRSPRRLRVAYLLGALVLAAVVLVAVWNRNHHDTPTAHRTPSTATSETNSGTVPISEPPKTAPGPVVLGGFTPPVRGNFSLYARAGNAVLHFDFAAGRLTSTTLPVLQSTGPVTFLAPSRGAIVRPIDAVPGYLIPDGEPARELTGVLARAAVLPGPDSDHVWIDYLAHDRLVAEQLVDTNGQHPGPVLHLPPNPYGEPSPDRSGYLLAVAKGGLFDVRPGGTHRVAEGTGTVVAAGGDRLLVTTCARGAARPAACPAYIVSARTGGRRSLAPLQAVQNQSPGPISADGRTAAVFTELSPGTVGLQLIDLTTGRTLHTPVPVDPAVAGGTATGGSGAAVFSPDGRWLFLVAATDTVVAVDVATGAVHGLGTPLPNVLQLAVRAS